MIQIIWSCAIMNHICFIKLLKNKFDLKEQAIMKTIVILLLLSTFPLSVSAADHTQKPLKHQQNFAAPQNQFNIHNIQSYGHFKKMIHKQKTIGVVSLLQALDSHNSYAVGALGNGKGEITVLNSKAWLDYGSDGIGNAVNNIPTQETAVLLVTAQVTEWQQVTIPTSQSSAELHAFILEQAKKLGLNSNQPFPFMLSGTFNELQLHVINGTNPHFAGHGSGEYFYNQHRIVRKNQAAEIIGFFSASNQGVYTHPGESWHLHAVIEDELISAHIDEITVQKNTILKLPRQSNSH